MPMLKARPPEAPPSGRPDTRLPGHSVTVEDASGRLNIPDPAERRGRHFAPVLARTALVAAQAELDVAPDDAQVTDPPIVAAVTAAIEEPLVNAERRVLDAERRADDAERAHDDMALKLTMAISLAEQLRDENRKLRDQRAQLLAVAKRHAWVPTTIRP